MAEKVVTTMSHKTFEMLMCKKVAELTQVVHLLFVKNHEKEVEIEAIKRGFLVEFQRISKEATDEINSLHQKLKQTSSHGEKHKHGLQVALADNDKKWQQKFTELESKYKKQKAESDKLKDAMLSREGQIKDVTNSLKEDLHEATDNLKRKNDEIEGLKENLINIDHKYKENQRNFRTNFEQLKASNEELNAKITELQTILRDAVKTREEMIRLQKAQESEIFKLKKELSRKNSLMQHVMSSQQDSNNHNFIQDEIQRELNQLRKENIRYRMELYNREDNFNRVFSEKQPVILGRKSNLRSTSEPSSASLSSPRRESHPFLGKPREIHVNLARTHTTLPIPGTEVTENGSGFTDKVSLPPVNWGNGGMILERDNTLMVNNGNPGGNSKNNVSPSSGKYSSHRPPPPPPSLQAQLPHPHPASASPRRLWNG